MDFYCFPFPIILLCKYSKCMATRFLKGDECSQAPMQFSQAIMAFNSPHAPELFVSLFNTIFSFYPSRWNYALTSRNPNSPISIAEVVVAYNVFLIAFV